MIKIKNIMAIQKLIVIARDIDNQIGALSIVKQRLLIFITIFVFAVLNILTLERSPSVWVDEVMLIDPGVMLAQTGQFISTAWIQSSTQTFGSYCPGYALLLSAWIELFGFSIFSVRLLPVVLVSIAAYLVWRIVILNFIKSPLWRFLSVCIVLSSYGTTFLYRSGRGDILGVLVILLATCAAIERHRYSNVIIFACGLILPLIGLVQCVVAAIVATVSAFVFPYIRRPVITFAVAGVIGALLLVVGLDYFGALSSFIANTFYFTSVVKLGAGGLADPSVWCIILSAFFVLGWKRIVAESLTSKPIILLLVVAFASPITVYMLSHYLIYYNWSFAIPIFFAFASISDRTCRVFSYKTIGLFIGFCIAILLGVPARTGIALLSWQSRDYSSVIKLVQDNLNPDDVVIADYQAYYALRYQNAAAYFVNNWETFSTESNSVATVAVIKPIQLKIFSSIFGDDWVEVDCLSGSSSFGASAYDLIVLRKLKD